METLRLPSRSTRRRVIVVLPAPEGEERTRSRPRRPISGELMRALFDVLHLLAELLDPGLELEADPGQLDVRRLGAERIGLAVELLAEKIETPASGATLGKQLARCRYVCDKPIKLLADIAARHHQCRLLSEPLLGNRRHRVLERVHQRFETRSDCIGLRSG